MVVYLGSSFSIQMVANGATIEIKRLMPGELFQALNPSDIARDDNGDNYHVSHSIKFSSCIGHEGTAQYLGKYFPGATFNRCSVELHPGDVLYVAQPVGERLAPGTELTDVNLSYYRVRIMDSLRVQKALALFSDYETEKMEAEEDRQCGVTSAASICQSCNKPVNPVCVMFGIKSQTAGECQC